MGHKSEYPDIHDNIVTESDSAEFFEHMYAYNTRLESSSGGSKQPLEEPKQNETNDESPRRSKFQRTVDSF